MHIIESGNTAAAYGVKLAGAQVIAAYPITPQTPLTEKLSEFVAAGELDAQYVPVESEHSALSVCIAASSTGTRAFTATSANGLLYMSEQVHWAAGARLPIVMCVVNRGVGAPWTIWNDHQDAMSQRDSGWIQIYCADHQQIIDTVMKSFLLAETVSIPVMVCYDGYLLSHTYMPFELPDAEKTAAFLPPFAWERLLNPDAPRNINTVTMPDLRPDQHGTLRPGYMDIRHELQVDLRRAVDEVTAVDRKFREVFGRGDSSLVEPYRCEDADVIAVCIGSLSYQFRDVVDALREEGLKVGVLGIRMYRPFPDKMLMEALSGAKAVAVFEKAMSYGNQGPLFGDVRATFYGEDKQPHVHGFVLGLGGREIKTAQLKETLRSVCDKPETTEKASRWLGIRM